MSMDKREAGTQVPCAHWSTYLRSGSSLCTAGPASSSSSDIPVTYLMGHSQSRDSENQPALHMSLSHRLASRAGLESPTREEAHSRQYRRPCGAPPSEPSPRGARGKVGVRRAQTPRYRHPGDANHGIPQSKTMGPTLPEKAHPLTVTSRSRLSRRPFCNGGKLYLRNVQYSGQ